MATEKPTRKTEYRSSLRSKRLIISAFLELLGEKEFDRITVTEIAERADLNRRTFYAHYSDVRAVMDEIEERASEQIIGFIREINSIEFWTDPISLFTQITDYLKKDQYMYRIMLNASTSASFVTRLQREFADYMRTLPYLPAELRQTQDYLNRAYFYAGGIANLYVMWFRGELGGTLEDVANTLTKMIMSDPLIADLSGATE